MTYTSTSTAYSFSVNSNSSTAWPTGTQPGFEVSGAAIGDAAALTLGEAVQTAFRNAGITDATVSVSKNISTSAGSQGDYTVTPPVFD
jgi:hypothetical protein